MKKWMGFTLVLFMFAGFFFLGSSVGGDGENLFHEKCGQCHRKGSDAPVFAPVKYASIQWERFFEREKHKRKKDIGGVVSPEEIDMIKEYLIDHAADSDRPIAAGLR